MTLTPAQLGFLRSLLGTLVFALLAFLGNADNLNGVVSTGGAALIAALAMSLEGYLHNKTGSALFGAVTLRK